MVCADPVTADSTNIKHSNFCFIIFSDPLCKLIKSSMSTAACDLALYVANFLDKIDRTGNCWIWTASVHTAGYGSFAFRGKRWKSHRISYTLFVGEIPEEMHVLHRCDNKLCCNPFHLFLGTHLDNMRDAAAKLILPHGSAHCHAKLNESQVAEIRRRYIKGARWRRGNKLALQQEFGIGPTAIVAIVGHKSWKHVT